MEYTFVILKMRSEVRGMVKVSKKLKIDRNDLKNLIKDIYNINMEKVDELLAYVETHDY